ncbi:hypothetical protein LO977_003331 [Vibrio metschnikovii]|nr:hypothetical protein [Vibrio metschnikovii]
MSINLNDPLSEVTRKERKVLLGLSMVSLFFSQAGILPSKISALGIELKTTDQNEILYLMSIALFYFVCAFFLYAISDFMVWRKAITKENRSQFQKMILVEYSNPPSNPIECDMQSEDARLAKKNRIWVTLTKPISIARGLFEFVLPVIFGFYAIIMMLLKASNT